MANEIRLRANNVQGTITDNPLTNVATTINSAGFVDLPTVTGSNHLMLILDPLETAGPAEIVMVTAHTAASTVVTVVRAQESSGARSHAFGTTWFHGPTVADWNFTDRLALSTNRPASPFIGQMIYETDTARWVVWNGSVWLPAPQNVPACRVHQAGAGQVILNNTLTVITFDTELYDTDSLHSISVNTGRITFNTAGVYTLTGCVQYPSNVTGRRYANFTLNAATQLAAVSLGTNAAGTETVLNLTTTYKFIVGDFAEFRTLQDSGGSLTLTVAVPVVPHVTATWVGVG